MQWILKNKENRGKTRQIFLDCVRETARQRFLDREQRSKVLKEALLLLLFLASNQVQKMFVGKKRLWEQKFFSGTKNKVQIAMEAKCFLL